MSVSIGRLDKKTEKYDELVVHPHHQHGGGPERGQQ